jgi:1-aminocyclopropane-1-carboxylate deaminase
MAITKQYAFIQPLNPLWYQPYAERVDMLRLDLLHPIISGNKWFKLKHNLRFAIEKGYDDILTFGGGYSNHLVTTAAAAKEFGLRSIGIVRGKYDKEELTTTLQTCLDLNMELVFVTKEEYARKTDPIWLDELSKKYDHPYIIPEGGANQKGREGAEEIAELIPQIYTHVCLSLGTGTTFVGVRNRLPDTQMLLGFVPMKKGEYLADEIKPYIKENKSWQVFARWHLGGFGKWNDKLLGFMNNFHHFNNIPLDVVYTGKMMYGLEELLREHFFSRDAKILCIHTGGLQGNASVQDMLEY